MDIYSFNNNKDYAVKYISRNFQPKAIHHRDYVKLEMDADNKMVKILSFNQYSRKKYYHLEMKEMSDHL